MTRRRRPSRACRWTCGRPSSPATLRHIPEAETKIAFDKFHVAKLLGDAMDKVRRQEHRQLSAQGMEVLKGSKYAWLTNAETMTAAQRQRFIALRDSALKTARAWAIKDLAMGLWHYRSRTWAMKAWKRWLGWALRCRLAPIPTLITLESLQPCSCAGSAGLHNYSFKPKPLRGSAYSKPTCVVEAKAWQAFYATLLLERSKLGLNDWVSRLLKYLASA